MAAAKADVGRLAKADPQLAKLALRVVRDLEAGVIDGESLEEMAVVGDLEDCRKLYFGRGKPPSHRIIYRELGESKGVEILEIVAVEQREELYAFLLASARLGRLPVESKQRFNRLHQRVIHRRAERRPQK